MEIDNKALGIEFIFNLNFKKQSNRVKFHRKLYGHRRYSNHGRYVYLEEGVLSNIPYLKPTKSMIIVSEKNAKTIREFFKTWKIEFKERKVILNKKEAEKINLEEGFK